MSVMIPTYNQARFICRAIQSALNQSYKNIEIIISDDWSSDDTQSVVTDFIRQNSQRCVIYHRNSENLGILRNYHDNLLRATGDLVINLDGDDFFVNPNFIEQSVALFQECSDLALVFGDYCEHYEDTNERLDICNTKLARVMSDYSFYSAFADNKILWNHNTILYKRDLALTVGFYWDPVLPRNDWESFLRLIAGHKVGYLSDIQAAWVHHGRNETKRLDINKYLNNYVLINQIALHAEDYFDKTFLDRWRKKMILLKTKGSAIGYLMNRDFKGLTRFLSAASKVESMLMLSVLTSPGFIFRAAICLNPRLYRAVKTFIRQSR